MAEDERDAEAWTKDQWAQFEKLLRAILRLLKAAEALSANWRSDPVSEIDLCEIRKAAGSHDYHRRKSEHLFFEFRNFLNRKDFDNASYVSTVIKNGWVSEDFCDVAFDVCAELGKIDVIKLPANDIERAKRKRLLRYLRSMGIKIETAWE
jgi:hypothetical protein